MEFTRCRVMAGTHWFRRFIFQFLYLFNDYIYSERNAIDGACLEVLNEEDLNELGIVSSVKRKKLL